MHPPPPIKCIRRAHAPDVDRVERSLLERRWDALPRLRIPRRPLPQTEVRRALDEMHHQPGGVLDPDGLELLEHVEEIGGGWLWRVAQQRLHATGKRKLPKAQTIIHYNAHAPRTWAPAGVESPAAMYRAQPSSQGPGTRARCD